MLPGLMLIAALTPAPVDTMAREVTLAEAVAMAERHAPAMIAARGQERTAAAAVRGAYAAFLPNVSLSAGATRRLPNNAATTRVENGQVVTLASDPWSYNVGLGANVDLFVGGRRWFELQQAHSQESGAEVNAVTQQYATRLAVARSYYDALAAHESGDAAQAALDQAEQLLGESTARLKVHTVTRSDSLRAEIQVRAARLDLLQARTDLAVANATLTRATGSDQLLTASAADTTVNPELAVDDATLRALAEASPLIQAARASLASARAAKRSSWSTYLPSLTASYSRTGNGTGTTLLPTDDGFNYNGSLRLAASLPLFNQLDREAQVAQADVAEQNAAASLHDALLAAREQLAQYLGTFRTARERVASQTATLEAAEEDLRVQQQRYAIGGSTHLDVLTSQTQLEQARRDLIRARYDLRIARAQLEALVGRTL